VQALADDGATTKASKKARATADGGCSAEHPAARIAGGPGLPARVVERLTCSGRIRTIVFDPRIPPGQAPNVLDIGGSHRVVTDKQFRALLLRDGGCAHPGCHSQIGLEAHHVQHWLHGGKTILANLVLLCRRHHHAHHDGEFLILPLGRGRFRFLTADGHELPNRVAPSELAASHTPIENEHDHVAADAATTRWNGTKLDRDYAITALAQGLHSTEHWQAADRERRTETPPYDPWALPPNRQPFVA
jgi:hypothetical protein